MLRSPPFGLKSEARKMAGCIWNRDAFVVDDTFHAKCPISREVVIKSVTHVAGGEIKLRHMIVRGRIQPSFLGFRLFGEPEPGRVPALVVLDLGRDATDLLEAGGRSTVQLRPVQRVVHARIGQQMHEGHVTSPLIEFACLNLLFRPLAAAIA